MNVSGPIRPRSGCCQRSSASTLWIARDGDADLRLEMQPELLTLQRRLESGHHVEPALRQAAHVLHAMVVAIAAELLGDVHGLIGVIEQAPGLGAVEEVEADADAAGQTEPLIVFGEGLGQRRQDLAGDRGGVLDVGEAFEDDRELIAPDLRHGVGFADDGDQPRGDPAQGGVAGAMPEPVVDRLEVVEVEVQNRERARLPLGPDGGVGQAILERIAVRKAGQLIEVGLVDEPLQPGLALDRVTDGAQQGLAVSRPLTQKSCAP